MQPSKQAQQLAHNQATKQPNNQSTSNNNQTTKQLFNSGRPLPGLLASQQRLCGPPPSIPLVEMRPSRSFMSLTCSDRPSSLTRPDPSGTPKHQLSTARAQGHGLTRVGYTKETAQLSGRWGSDAIARYIQESTLDQVEQIRDNPKSSRRSKAWSACGSPSSSHDKLRPCCIRCLKLAKMLRCGRAKCSNVVLPSCGRCPCT